MKVHLQKYINDLIHVEHPFHIQQEETLMKHSITVRGDGYDEEQPLSC